jgi:hypothetical protein
VLFCPKVGEKQNLVKDKGNKPRYATSIVELIKSGVYFGSSTILRDIQNTVLKYLKADDGLTCSLTTKTWLLTASDQKRKGTLENESMRITSEKIIINGLDEDSLQKNKQYIGRILALEHRY